MSKVLITGYPQTRHIKRLLSENGHEVSEFQSTKKLHLLRTLDYHKQIKDADYIYFVGGNIISQKLYLKTAKKYNTKVIIHWVGSDVYYLPQRIDALRPYIEGATHLVCSELLRDELAEFGIDAAIIPVVPFEMEMELQEMPQTHAALVYLPTGKEEFYGVELIRALALARPEIPFHIVANEGYGALELPNVKFHGKLDLAQMNELYKEISLLIRLPLHDGLSMMVIEGIVKGKRVLYKYKHPYVDTPDTMSEEDVISAFNKIVDAPPTLNMEGNKYVNDNYTPGAVIKLYKEFKVF